MNADESSPKTTDEFRDSFFIWGFHDHTDTQPANIRTPTPRPPGHFQAGSDAELLTTIDLFYRSEEVVVERLKPTPEWETFVGFSSLR